MPTGVFPPTRCMCGISIFDWSDGKTTLFYYGATGHWRNLQGERVMPIFDEDGYAVEVDVI